jgi:hypothetical protein
VGARADSNGCSTRPIALTTAEHCVSAGQTVTVLASFETNEDGLLCARDADAFMYRGTIKSAIRHLQEKADTKRTWQYICAVRCAASSAFSFSIELLTRCDRLPPHLSSPSHATKPAHDAAGYSYECKINQAELQV